MIDSSSDSSVTFCELVEHPGGRDGGVFPQFATYRVEPGRLVLDTGLPESPIDVFDQQDPARYVPVLTQQQAAQQLALELDRARSHVRHLEQLLVRFRYDQAEFVVLLDEEPYEADE